MNIDFDATDVKWGLAVGDERPRTVLTDKA